MNNETWDEDELVQRLKKKQEAAYRYLIQEYQPKLFNVVYGITLDREESLDILQEVFLKVYVNIEKFKGESKLFTWIRSITVNESLNWRRKIKRKFKWKHQPLDTVSDKEGFELGSDENGPENFYRKKELEECLNQELNLLPEDARTIFVLKEMEGLSYEEIGRLLKIKKGTVSSRIFYVRQRLKKSMEKIIEE